MENKRRSILDCVGGRKRVLLIAAAILAARKLSQFDGGKRVPATVSAISDAIRWAEEIMQEIDRKWPTPRQSSSKGDSNGDGLKAQKMDTNAVR